MVTQKMNIFITGTDTDVGKTFITAGLAALMQSLGYKTGVYKPFQSGAEEKNGFLIAPDLVYVKKIDAFVETSCTYLMKPATAPSLAAEIENIHIDMNNIARDYKIINEKCELVITEGAGGLCAPIAPNMLNADIAKLLNLPVVIVARPNLGTINHVLLTINYAQQHGIDVRGVIINRYPKGTDDIAVRTAPRLIEEYSDVKVLGIVRDIETPAVLTPGGTIDTILNSVDVEKIFQIKIPKLDAGI